MDPIIEKFILAIVGFAATSLCTWLGVKISKYKKLIKKEEDEILKKTINNTLSPINDQLAALNTDMGGIKTDISKMKNDIKNLQNSEINFKTRLEPTQEEIEHMKDDITEILNTLKTQGIDINNLQAQENRLEHETRCAWRYRIRQLCHAYLRRGWMSHDEYAQLQEMFNIYTAIGGNGQTKELYDKTMQLEMKSDEEAAKWYEEHK